MCKLVKIIQEIYVKYLNIIKLNRQVNILIVL